MRLLRFPWPYLIIIFASVGMIVLIQFWAQPLFHSQSELEPYSEEWRQIEMKLLDYFVYQVLSFLFGVVTLIVMFLHWAAKAIVGSRNALS